MRVFLQLDHHRAEVERVLQVMGHSFEQLGEREPRSGDLVITERAGATEMLAQGAKVVRLGVDIELPGAEVDLMRIIDTATLTKRFPIALFAGIRGGVGTTTAVEAAVRSLSFETVFVLDLVQDPTLRHHLSDAVILSWTEVSFDPDIVLSRIPKGVIAIVGSANSPPPHISKVASLTTQLQRVGPVIIDAGRWSEAGAKFSSATRARPMLVGKKAASRLQMASARHWLRQFNLESETFWVPKRARAKQLGHAVVL